jgi:hypothetical protein
MITPPKNAPGSWLTGTLSSYGGVKDSWAYSSRRSKGRDHGKEAAAGGGAKDKPSRTEQARQVAEEYANDLRDIIKNLRKRPN